MSLTIEASDFVKYTMQDVLERLRALEQTYMRNRVDLSKRVDDLERDNVQLKKVNEVLKKKCSLLDRTVSQMQREQFQAQSLTHEKIDRLDKTRMVLNKAFVRSHVTGHMQILADNVKTLFNWKEIKRRTDNERFKSLEDSIGALDMKVSGLQESSRDTIDSIICARLEKQSFESSPSIKLQKYSSKLFELGNGLSFDSTMGVLTGRNDGVYQLSWRMVHKNVGKIRYSMHIQGMRGSIYLGCTRASGDVCAGSVLLLLKTDQKVWLEANLRDGYTATIQTGTLMAYQLTKCPLGDLEDVVTMQGDVFSMGIIDCQHL